MLQESHYYIGYVLKWMKGKDNLQSERAELDIQLQDRILPSDQFRS